MSSLLN